MDRDNRRWWSCRLSRGDRVEGNGLFSLAQIVIANFDLPRQGSGSRSSGNGPRLGEESAMLSRARESRRMFR